MTAKRKPAPKRSAGNKAPAAKAGAAAKPDELRLPATPGKSDKQRLADVALHPAARTMAAGELFNRAVFGETGTTENYKAAAEKLDKAKGGDLAEYRSMLAGQALTLDAIFTEMARRSARNMGEYLGAMETYMRLALKAQAQSRATVEALDRLVTGREQVVRHVHVNEGGQAVIADQFHNHTGGQKNGQSSEQPHATGTGPAGASPALPGPDPIGDPVPLASGEGAGAMPNARGQGKRRA